MSGVEIFLWCKAWLHCPGVLHQSCAWRFSVSAMGLLQRCQLSPQCSEAQRAEADGSGCTPSLSYGTTWVFNIVPEECVFRPFILTLSPARAAALVGAWWRLYAEVALPTPMRFEIDLVLPHARSLPGTAPVKMTQHISFSLSPSNCVLIFSLSIPQQSKL